MAVTSLSELCRDGRFVPVPGGVYFHPGTMADAVDLLALTRAMSATRPAAGGAVVLPDAALERPSALRAVRIALETMPSGAVLTGMPGSPTGLDTWLAAADVTGAHAYLAYRPGMPLSPRVVPVDAADRETTGTPAAVRVLPRADAAARELLHSAARLAQDQTQTPLARVRELGASSSAAYLMAVGMVLTGSTGDWDPARLTPPTAAEVWTRFGTGTPATADVGAALAAGTRALVRVSGRLFWLIPDGDSVWAAGPGGLVPAGPEELALAGTRGAVVALHPPESSDGELLRRALDVLPPYDTGVPDCVDRVAFVLGHLGTRMRAAADDGLRPRDLLAARMGGRFHPPGAADRLSALQIGAITPVWTVDKSHMVLVHRSGERNYTLVETQEPGRNRFQHFTFADGNAGLPTALRGPVRLVGDAGGALLQAAVRTREVFSGPDGSATAERLIDALLDPAIGRREPGLVGTELETAIRVGVGRDRTRYPGAMQGESLSGETLATIPSLGLTFKVDVAPVELGRSGTWYMSAEQAKDAGDPVVRSEWWDVVEVVTDPGAAVPEEVGSVHFGTLQLHQLGKAAIRWLQHAGRHGFTVGQAFQPHAHGDRLAAVFDAWHHTQSPGSPQRRVGDALIAPGRTTVSKDRYIAGETLHFPEHIHPSNIYLQATPDSGPAGLPTLLDLIQLDQAGTDSQGEPLAFLQRSAAGVAQLIATRFLEDRAGRPLTDAQLGWLLRSEETNMMRGAITTVLTHVFAKPYAAMTETGPKNGLLSLSRHHLNNYNLLMSVATGLWTRDHALQIIDWIEEALSDEMATLTSPGDSLLDEQWDSSNGDGPWSGREVLLAFFTNSGLDYSHHRLIDRTRTFEPHRGPGEMGWQYAHEIRSVQNLVDPVATGDAMMRLDDTDTALRWVTWAAERALRAAKAARRWNSEVGGLNRAIAAIATTEIPPEPPRELWRRDATDVVVEVGRAAWRTGTTPAERLDELMQIVEWLAEHAERVIGTGRATNAALARSSWDSARYAVEVATTVVAARDVRWAHSQLDYTEVAIARASERLAALAPDENLFPPGRLQPDAVPLRQMLDDLDDVFPVGDPDCVERVTAGLRLLRGTPVQATVDGALGWDELSGLVGGWFGPPGGISRLRDLAVGALTPVWAVPRQLPAGAGDLSTPERHPHMVLVYRRDAHRFRLIETQARASGRPRFEDFTVGGGRLPEVLRGTVRLVGDADLALRQLSVRTGVVSAATPGSAAPERTAGALTDPATGARAPGLVGEELETMIRIGAPRLPDPKTGIIPRGDLSSATLGTVWSLGLEIKADETEVALGRSGRWYPTEQHLAEAGDTLARIEGWDIVEVVTEPGAALDEELAGVRLTAAQQHRSMKAATRWLEHAGRHGLTVRQALDPRAADRTRLLDDWAATRHGDRERADARALRAALLQPGNVRIGGLTAGKRLHFPENVHPASYFYQATPDFELAGLPTMLEMTQLDQAGTRSLPEDVALLQIEALGLGGRVAEEFLQSLAERPLRDDEITWLLRSEEATALRGTVATGVTQALAMSFARKGRFNPKNGALLLSRADLIEYARLPGLAASWMTEHADRILTRVQDELADRLKVLRHRGVHPLDRVEASADGQPDYTARARLRSLFSADRHARLTQPRIYGGMKAVASHTGPPGVGRQYPLELRHVQNMRDPAPGGDNRMTLDDTDTAFDWVLHLSDEAHGDAQRAREWNARQGGLLEAIARLEDGEAPPEPEPRPELTRRDADQVARQVGDARWRVDDPAVRLAELQWVVTAAGPVVLEVSAGTETAVRAVYASWLSFRRAVKNAAAITGLRDARTAHLALDFAEVALDRLAERAEAVAPQQKAFFARLLPSDRFKIKNALDQAEPWDGTPDCVDRVGAVLRTIGAPMRSAETDGLRGRDALAARLGGWFTPPAGRDRLDELRVGAITPVWVQPLMAEDGTAAEQSVRAHLVLVYRHDDQQFTLVETQFTDAARFEDFTIDEPPDVLIGTLRLVTDADGGLRQVVVATEEPIAGPPGRAAPSVIGRTEDALLDPRRARREPGRVAVDTRPATPQPAGTGKPPAPVAVPVLGLGRWDDATMARIRELAPQAGRPVIAVDLSGTPAAVTAVAGELGEALRWYARIGPLPLVVASEATAHGRREFEEVRARWRPPALTPEPAGFDRVWRLRDGDGASVTLEPTMTAAAFRAAAVLSGSPARTLPAPLIGWLSAYDPGPAEAYQRGNVALLHVDAVSDVLRGLAEADPDDVRLAVFRTALEVGRRAGGLSGVRPRPSVTSTLAVEPAYDPAERGPVPVSFVYDYLAVRGGRKERFAWDGLLFQLLLAGELDDRQALALVRATAVTAADLANLAVVEVFLALRDLPAHLMDEDPMTHPEVRPILERIGRLTRGAGGSYADCVDPVDRIAWIGRLDAYRAVLDAVATGESGKRAELIRVAADLLSHC
ncbi:hypothetical protein ACIA8K_31015 [Catenuloplanes sp. NPDC051500]|uniref:hypothetical protein n=1 Tax=Catenuloplanes sp. NPDC051500 TaxID=3363959 RepID=UPI00378FE6C0